MTFAYTAEDYNGTPKERCYNIAFEKVLHFRGMRILETL